MSFVQPLTAGLHLQRAMSYIRHL